MPRGYRTVKKCVRLRQPLGVTLVIQSEGRPLQVHLIQFAHFSSDATYIIGPHSIQGRVELYRSCAFRNPKLEFVEKLEATFPDPDSRRHAAGSSRCAAFLNRQVLGGAAHGRDAHRPAPVLCERNSARLPLGVARCPVGCSYRRAGSSRSRSARSRREKGCCPCGRKALWFEDSRGPRLLARSQQFRRCRGRR